MRQDGNEAGDAHSSKEQLRPGLPSSALSAHRPRDISAQHRVQGPRVAADQPLTHRIVAEELTVAAVAELPVFLVGGGGGAGTALRAAVLILPKPLVCLAWLWRVAAGTVRELVPFARGVPEEKGRRVRGEEPGGLQKSLHPLHA